MLNANEKYRDVYAQGATDTQSSNYEANLSKNGDAVYETSTAGSGSTSWNGDGSNFPYSNLPYTSIPFFLRGGYYGNGSSAGVFAFSGNTGNISSISSFRVVLVP